MKQREKKGDFFFYSKRMFSSSMGQVEISIAWTPDNQKKRLNTCCELVIVNHKHVPEYSKKTDFKFVQTLH